MPRRIAIGCLALALSLDAQTQLDMKRDEDPQLAMKRDAARALRNAENVLIVAVTIYRKRLDQAQQAAFDESQLRWVASRKATCDFQAHGIADSSAHEIILAHCLTEYANQRVDTIIQLMDCAEGNSPCPAS